MTSLLPFNLDEFDKTINEIESSGFDKQNLHSLCCLLIRFMEHVMANTNNLGSHTERVYKKGLDKFIEGIQKLGRTYGICVSREVRMFFEQMAERPPFLLFNLHKGDVDILCQYLDGFRLDLERVNLDIWHGDSKKIRTLIPEEQSIKDRFEFRPNDDNPGQVRYGNIDLNLKLLNAGVLKKLVDNFGKLVSYKELAVNYGSENPTIAAPVLAKCISQKIRPALCNHKIPAKIENVRMQGYKMVLKK